MRQDIKWFIFQKPCYTLGRSLINEGDITCFFFIKKSKQTIVINQECFYLPK